MKTNKFTKGEWSILPRNEQHKWFSITSEKGIIARTFYGEREPSVSMQEAKANAKLISAAHELLEALMSIENDNNSIPKAIWDLRNSAIKKATE